MSILFEPVTIGTLEVKNRFVRSATHDYMGHSDGTLSDAEYDLYRCLAENDVGMIITAHAYIQHPLGRASINQNGIFDDRFIEGYRKLAALVGNYGSKLILQISHAGRQVPPDWDTALVPVSSSAVKDNLSGVMPREMTSDEIWQVIDDFSQAMLRAKKAGCHGVQLHIAHGYFLSQFLSPYTNRRTDEWGGTFENRTRIIREIMLRSRRAVGNEYPVLAKLNSTDGFEGPDYLLLDDVVRTAKLLETLGINAIEVSGGIRDAKGVMCRPGIKEARQEAYFAPAASAVKQAVSIPVILVGGLRSKEVMQQVITDSIADMVSLSRPFVKQPDLVCRLREGAEKVECLSCNACFNPNGLHCYLEVRIHG
jgi:2,4-dienoyl-CoA reductase-like NADH-dependent reductase (Old Yellow Enzyme family)